MRIDAFDYELPADRIAQRPLEDRGAARLMVVPPRGEATHSRVASLPDLIPEGTVIVLNDTRVVPARLLGKKEGTGGQVEVFLLRQTRASGGPDEPALWTALGRASKGLRSGTRIDVGDLKIEVVSEQREGGLLEVALSSKTSVTEAIHKWGKVPLPPYIRREADDADAERYQTVFARVDGAVAAPTAGLHLSRELLESFRGRGCETVSVTLHVGLGTFQPVTVQDLDDHPMHEEAFDVPEATALAIARARERGAGVLAIGTTTVRALESAADPARPGHVRASVGETKLLIQPGYAFRVVDHLFTNFHLPRSTLLAMVCAFGSTPLVLRAYETAVREGYRFFSYGDAMLLGPRAGSQSAS